MIFAGGAPLDLMFVRLELEWVLLWALVCGLKLVHEMVPFVGTVIWIGQVRWVQVGYQRVEWVAARSG